MMSKQRFWVIAVVILAFLLLDCVILYNNFNQNSKLTIPSGTSSRLPIDIQIQEKVNSFLEGQLNKSDLLLKKEKEHYHCSNLLYGYDDQYIYVWMYCGSYIVQNTIDVARLTAFSIPMRFEYQSQNFQIVDYKQPGDGSAYASSLKQIFPSKFYNLAIAHPSTETINILGQTVKSRAQTDIHQ